MRARGRLKAAAHIHCSGISTLTTSPPLSARSSSGDGALAPKVENLLPRVLEWYTRVETELLPQGRLLSETEMKIARQLGVIRPERVRIIVLETFPMPEDRVLRAETKRYGLGSAAEGARAIGYVIMLKPRYAKSSMIIAHEPVHVSQHDRLGRAAFLRRYITEMEMLGYFRSPLGNRGLPKTTCRSLIVRI